MPHSAKPRRRGRGLKNLASRLNHSQRRALIDWGDDRALSVQDQAALLSVNRSGLYYHPVGPSAEEGQIKHRIDAIYTELPFYGSRRLTAQLQRAGDSVNRKRIQGYMRDMGIADIHPGPHRSRRQTDQAKFPYLLRHLVVAHPHHVWGSEMTYLRLHGG